MITLLSQYQTPIADYLEQCAESVRAIDGAGWEFTLQGEVPSLVTARQAQGWLRLCCPLSAPSSCRPAPEVLDRMLAHNGELAGGVKFTLADDPPLPCLSAEILLDDEQFDLATRISRTCDGFCQASQAFTCGQHPDASRAEGAHAPESAEGSDELAFDLPALCRETGWSLVQRAANQVAVELDVPDCFCQALVQPRGPHGLHLAVNMPCAPSLGATNRYALSVMLLHACHWLRMARATARITGGIRAFAWEVSLERMAGSREVKCALEALSVACRVSAREVSAFQQDESLARRYLVLRGWCS